MRAAAAQLAGGQLVTVPASLIKRQKQHFNTLPGTGGSRACSASNQRAPSVLPLRGRSVALRMPAFADTLPRHPQKRCLRGSSCGSSGRMCAPAWSWSARTCRKHAAHAPRRRGHHHGLQWHGLGCAAHAAAGATGRRRRRAGGAGAGACAAAGHAAAARGGLPRGGRRARAGGAALPHLPRRAGRRVAGARARLPGIGVQSTCWGDWGCGTAGAASEQAVQAVPGCAAALTRALVRCRLVRRGALLCGPSQGRRHAWAGYWAGTGMPEPGARLRPGVRVAACCVPCGGVKGAARARGRPA